MSHKQAQWYEQPPTFPALLPPYNCPCCGENRESVQYDGDLGTRCAECVWSNCDGVHDA